LGQGVTPSPPNDAQLIERMASRDEQALAELYDRYGSLAFAVAYRILDDRGIAQDAVQEAFLSIWKRAASFDSVRGSARAWLLTVVRNAAIDHKRGRHRHRDEEELIDDYAYRLTAGDIWEDVAARLDRETIRQALQKLPISQRKTLEMAYFGGMTQTEIAAQTGEPLGTVKSRARLGLRHLESLLRREVSGDDR
jgi:RNA polymerase sigma-70 factor (ECF subfamily)